MISHALELAIQIAIGSEAFSLLPREINRLRPARRAAAPAPIVEPESSTGQ
jgi:hypothetical protein